MIKISLKRGQFDLAYNWDSIFYYDIGKVKKNNLKLFSENWTAKNKTPATKTFNSLTVGEKPASLKDNAQK